MGGEWIRSFTVSDVQDANHCFRDGPYKTIADVEYRWVDWYNNRRLHESLGMVPPVEYAQAHYAALTPEMQPV